MSKDRNIKLFRAAFYADLDVLQKIIVNKTDLRVEIPIPKGDYKMFWHKSYVEIDVLDILNWAAFGFYEYIDEERICRRMYDAKNIQILNDCINPSEYYNKVIKCIVWVCDKFSINNFQIKDYSRFRLLRHALFDDENWLDEDEMKEALEKGYREIDLNLMNEAEKGNGISCYNLVQKGADYNIDPIDYTDESAIVDILDGDMSFHILKMISYLSEREKWYESDTYHMLSSLYQVGVSNYILDIVMTDKARF
jgi:hypothetical protein